VLGGLGDCAAWVVENGGPAGPGPALPGEVDHRGRHLPDATAFLTLLAAGNPDYEELVCGLADYPSESGFRVYVWYQPGEWPPKPILGPPAAPALIPTVVVELPTALIPELTQGVRVHLARIAEAD
jgi:hypothetical protein